MNDISIKLTKRVVYKDGPLNADIKQELFTPREFARKSFVVKQKQQIDQSRQKMKSSLYAGGGPYDNDLQKTLKSFINL